MQGSQSQHQRVLAKAAEIRAKAKISNTPSLRTDDIASNEGPDEGRKCHNITEGDHGKTGLTQRKRNARIPRRRFSGIYRLPVFELKIRGFLKKGLTRKL